LTEESVSESRASGHDLYYEAAIGPKNTSFYLSKFERFDNTGVGASWNWPAFFVTFFWLLHRKMWGWAAVYFILPALIGFLVGLLFGDAGMGGSLYSSVYLIMVFLIFPMFANALYYRNIRKKIQQVTNNSGDEQKNRLAIAAKGGTSEAVVIVGALFMLFFMLVICAAIAIPAYQDYIVRSKLSEPLMALAESKVIVADYVERNGQFPLDTRELGINTAPRAASPTIASLSLDESVTGNVIRIVANVASCTWDGGLCNDTEFRSFHLAGTLEADGTMTWECLPGDSSGANAVEIKYLPAKCRG